MAKVKGEVDVSQDDKDTLDLFLADLNAARVEVGQATFLTIDAYASFVLGSALGSYIDGKRKKDSEGVASKYESSSQAVRSQVDALLAP